MWWTGFVATLASAFGIRHRHGLHVSHQVGISKEQQKNKNTVKHGGITFPCLWIEINMLQYSNLYRRDEEKTKRAIRFETGRATCLRVSEDKSLRPNNTWWTLGAEPDRYGCSELAKYFQGSTIIVLVEYGPTKDGLQGTAAPGRCSSAVMMYMYTAIGKWCK